METIAKIQQTINMATFQYQGRITDWQVIDAKLHRGRLFLYVRSNIVNLTKWIDCPRNVHFWTV